MQLDVIIAAHSKQLGETAMGIKLSDISVGSIVLVRTAFGNGPLVKGIVREKESDVKNGFPGITYDVVGVEDSSSWAYLTQVEQVLKR